MKKYLAIGHWKENKNATFCVAMKCISIADFRNQLGGNGFVPQVIISEKKLETLKMVDDFHLFDEVKKLTTNYRVWNTICDYIEQCLDIMEDKMKNAE